MGVQDTGELQASALPCRGNSQSVPVLAEQHASKRFCSIEQLVVRQTI